MSNIENAFIKQFEKEVHDAYQRQGSKLRATVRNRPDVKGASCVFPKVGKGAAMTKASGAYVPVMNLDHSTVEVTLSDFYAGDWVDKLDELKIAHDERAVLASAGAYALGRKTDELIINALNATTTSITTTTGGMTIAKCLEAFEKLGANDVPDDGQRFAVVGYKQWSELLSNDEFASAQYVGDDELPWKNTQAKRFLGTTWIQHNGLPINSGTGVRNCFWYHKTAIGFAYGQDVITDVSWHGDRASFFVNNMMSQGAGLIDTAGVVLLPCDETP